MTPLRFARLDAQDSTLVFVGAIGAGLDIIYFGPHLPGDAPLEQHFSVLRAPRRESTPDAGPARGILRNEGWDVSGPPSIRGRQNEGIWPALFLLESLDVGADWVRARFRAAQAQLTLDIEFDAVGHMFLTRRTVRNEGDTSFLLDWCASLDLPAPAWVDTAWLYEGRWGGEFRLRAHALGSAALEKMSRGGKPGFDGPGFALLGAHGANETSGRVIGAHFAWSGDQRLYVSPSAGGHVQLQMGEPLAPGEISLAPGEEHRTPDALFAYSDSGFNGVRAAFHAHARRIAAYPAGARKVHFNSWEAVYFDFDEARLRTLAEDAAALGAERFVLDDGWFQGRTSDRAGLGDWTPSLTRFPKGLGAFIAHVDQLGMDFGIWVEPEMVNPDSALYRAHPDWALHAGADFRPTQRGQLALDLSRRDVRDHLFGALDKLLSENRIAYLKWDHNRDLFPASSAGVPSAHRQTIGFYEILDRLRLAHPHVDIESCASGGGRIDFGVMTRTHRFWLSDNTDALARLAIQTDASIFLPPEMLGAHVGASPNPSTLRALPMAMRGRVSMFGHFGIEAAPARMSEDERAELAAHIALYKRFRGLLAEGRFLSFGNREAGTTCWISIAQDRCEALALLARADAASGAEVAPTLIPGLDPARAYRVQLLAPWPELAARGLVDKNGWREEPVLNGALLGALGIALPLTHAQTAWLIHFKEAL